MKAGWMAAVLCAGLSFAAQSALKPGERAPAFTAPASLAGKASAYSLKQGLAKGPVVVYFYPSAFTNGCNLQAHLFSEKSERFTAAGASIVGVSLDSIERLNEFSADPQYCAGKLSVASDKDGSIAKAFGLSVKKVAPGKKDTRGERIDHGRVERITFVVDRDGSIVSTIADLSPVDNVAKALESIEALAASR